MPVVRIITDHPVHYFLDNRGMGPISEFDPGQYYKVAPNVVRGFLDRGWAVLEDPPVGTPSEPREVPKPPPQPQPPPAESPKESPKPQPKPNDGDDVGEDERGTRKKGK